MSNKIELTEDILAKLGELEDILMNEDSQEADVQAREIRKIILTLQGIKSYW